MMFDDIDIRFETWADNKTPRKWVVSKVRYNEEDGFWDYKDLTGTTEVEFGTPFAAYNYAKNLLKRWKKKYSDAIIIIEEEVV